MSEFKELLTKDAENLVQSFRQPEPHADDNGFPAAVFPRTVQNLANELYTHYGSPRAVTYAAIIAATGAALGNYVELYNKSEWREAANVYMCVVGVKGSGKSHGMRIIFKPFYRRDAESHKAYILSLAAWESRRDQARADKYPFDEPQPVWKRLTFDSITIEKLAEVLKENPRGLIAINDELRGWFKSLTQYDNDSIDKWLRMFNRDLIQVDRMSRQTTQILSPFVSVIGTIQPEVLERMITPDFKECGLIDRMLFVSVPAELRYADGDVSPDILGEWDYTIDCLLNLSPETPRDIHMSTQARAAFTSWQKVQIKFLNENEAERNLGGKWENYLLRLALILHCLHEQGNSLNVEVSGDNMNNAIQLTKYFQQEFYKVAGDKDTYLVRQFSELQRQVYKKLPGEFLTSQGVKIAIENDMSERTFKRWLNDKKVFRFIRHGQYEKTLEL
jgi:hypothetical protein